jgi:hypothetical protein
MEGVGMNSSIQTVKDLVVFLMKVDENLPVKHAVEFNGEVVKLLITNVDVEAADFGQEVVIH